MTTTVEALFERWRARRDARALAEVFDRTAPELWRVALHLCGERAQADDLVQAAFLAAIESAAGWRVGEPLVPWLVGILANKLRMERRRARQELRGRPPAAAPDPRVAAEQNELRLALARAIAELPEACRSVLVLQLEHGLSAAEIAHALGRPRGTVRSQLSRAHEMLRRALPVTLVAGRGLAEQVPALAAVREAVLAAAGGGSLVSLSILGSVLAMKKLLVLAAVLVTFVVWSRWPAAPGSVAREAAAAGPAVAATGPARLETRASPAEREAVAGLQPRAESARARVVGRCLDPRDRLPLAGVLACLDSGPKVRTGDDGRFELAFAAPAEFWLELTLRGRAPIRVWTRATPGQVIDYGDVELAAGVRLRGRVVDTEGSPRAGSRLQLECTIAGAGTGPLLVKHAAIEGKPDGTFEVEDLLAPGSWDVRANEDVLVRPFTIVLDAQDGVREVEVVLAKASDADLIEGVVLDERDLPVAEQMVDRLPVVSGAKWYAETDRDGRFRMLRQGQLTKDPVTLGIGLLSPVGGWEPLTHPQKVAWGTKGLVLHARRTLKVEVQAVDAETGKPIEEFGVHCALVPGPGRPIGSGEFKLREAEEPHAGGILALGDVHRGKNHLLVEPRDRERWSIAPPLWFEAGDAGVPRQVVRVPRVAAREVEVVRKDGKPVCGTKLQLLLAVEPRATDLDTSAEPLATLFDGNSWPQALLLEEAQTDGTGRCLVHGPAGTKLSLRVCGPGHISVLVPDLVLAGEPLRVEVVAGAAVRGRVVPAGVVEELWPIPRTPHYRPGLVLTRRSPGAATRMPARAPDSFPVAADGTFAIDGIEPGSWELALQTWGRIVETAVVAKLADLADGETRELEVDASRLRPGELRGLVLVDGEPFAGARVDLWSGAVHNLLTDSAGRFVASLRPGTWEAKVALVQTGWLHSRDAPLRGSATVVAGKPCEAVFEITRRTVRARVLDAEGKPCAERALDVFAGGRMSCERTDAKGVLTYEFAPAGTMQFFLWPKELSTPELKMYARIPQKELETLRVSLGECVVGEDKKDFGVTLRLPK